MVSDNKANDEKSKETEQKKKERKPSILAPLAPLFLVLNRIALIGWTYVFVQLVIMIITATTKDDDDDDDWTTTTISSLSELMQYVFVLEGICIVEVIRIVLKDLPGNLVLGVVLHFIRVNAMTQIFPRLLLSTTQTTTTTLLSVLTVLLSWSVTEMTRYPMYVFPTSIVCRKIRMIVPLITFPIGCATEGYGAALVLQNNYNKEEGEEELSIVIQGLLCIMLFINGILGPTMAYPALLKKGVPVLLGKEMKKKKKKDD